MLIRQNVWRTALFHRTVLAERLKLIRSDAKSRQLAGLSNAIRRFEATSRMTIMIMTLKDFRTQLNGMDQGSSPA